MSHDSTFDTINALADEEHQLRAKEGNGTATDADRARIAEIEAKLDQLWDLLRQREGRKMAGSNPDGAAVRPADVVENYEQ